MPNETERSASGNTTTKYEPSPSGDRNHRRSQITSTSVGDQHNDIDGEYATNPHTLVFTNPETEQRFMDFCYIRSGFIGGKLWHVVGIVLFASFIIMFHPLGLGGGHRVLTDSRYILTDITMLSQTATLICTFVPKLYKWREHLLLISFSTHWPAISIINLLGKAPETMTYSSMLSCYFFCTFVAQIRFVRIFPFLVITPLLTLILIVTTQVDYFNTHSRTEMAFWPCVFFPVMLLRAFEKRTRSDFASMEKSDQKIEELETNITVVQSMVASFFPATPTYGLLLLVDNKTKMLQGKSPNREDIEMAPPRTAWPTLTMVSSGTSSHGTYAMQYINAAMIVTDLAGFTQWTASYTHNPSVVISLLTKMFLKIDGIMPMYNVEKIMTVGDAFIGVIFDNTGSSGADTLVGHRALLAAQFGCDILDTARDDSDDDEDKPERNPSTPTVPVPFVLDPSPKQGRSLKMRVGVHVGDFVGGFVGTKPPKFDCFGDDFEVAKRMESSGTPGFVHLSSAAAAAIVRYEQSLNAEHGSAAKCASGDDVDPTAAVSSLTKRDASSSVSESGGVLCNRWVTGDHSGVVSPLALPTSLLPDELPPSVEELEELINDKAMTVCEKLVALRTNNDFTVHSFTQRDIPASLLEELREKEESLVEAPQDDMNNLVDVEDEEEEDETNDAKEERETKEKDRFELNVWLMEFKSKSLERHFTASILESGSLTTSFGILALLQYNIVFAHALVGCIDTDQNRLILGGCLALTTVWMGYVQRYGVTKLRSVVICCTCCVLTYVLSVFQTSDCGRRGVTVNISNVITCYFTTAAVMPQFALNISMKFRAVVLVGVSMLAYVMLGLRHLAVGDDGVMSFDISSLSYAAVIGIYAGMTMSLDYSQRTGFMSRRKLLKLVSSARGRHADMASQALDIMLPSFISSALTKKHKKSDTEPGSGDDAPRSPGTPGSPASPSSPMLESVTTMSTSDADNAGIFDLGSRTKNMLWEYSQTVVMFIRFDVQSSSTLGQHAEINSIVSQLESIVNQRQVQKVKSIGNIFLAVSGIYEDDIDPIASMFHAAKDAKRFLLEWQSRFAKGGREEKDEARFSIGICSGPCFGAVIGVKGLCFDIFGDTVNTASRMCSTAPNGCIQMNDNTRMAAIVSEQLPGSMALEKAPVAITVKGKGLMEVYHLE